MLYWRPTEPNKQNCDEYITGMTSRKINAVLDAYLQETLGGQEKPLQKTRERREKIEETWVGTKPKNSTTFLRSRKNNNNKTKIYTSYI